MHKFFLKYEGGIKFQHYEKSSPRTFSIFETEPTDYNKSNRNYAKLYALTKGIANIACA